MYSDCEILLTIGECLCWRIYHLAVRIHGVTVTAESPCRSPNSYHTRVMYNIRWSAQRCVLLGFRRRVHRCEEQVGRSRCGCLRVEDHQIFFVYRLWVILPVAPPPNTSLL